MKISQSEDEMTAAATVLLRDCVEGLQRSLKQTDAESPTRRPRAYMRYREALLLALSVLDATTSGNARTAGDQLKNARRAETAARKAFDAGDAGTSAGQTAGK